MGGLGGGERGPLGRRPAPQDRRHGAGAEAIVDPDGVELFDLDRDPGETRDLVGTGGPEVQALVARRSAPGPLRAREQKEDLERRRPLPETVEALRALGYVED